MEAHVELHGSKALRTLLSEQLRDDQRRRTDVEELLKERQSDALTPAQLRLAATLLKELRAGDPAIPSLRNLLKGAHVKVVTDETHEDNEQQEKWSKYLARRRLKLQRLDEEMRYGNMVRNVKTQSTASELAHHQTSVRQHLSIGANMVMARITAFIAVYFVARSLTDSETTRMIAGLGGAIAMMVIEMVLFITRAAKMEAIEHEQMKHKSVF